IDQVTASTRLTAARDVVQALTDLFNAQNQFMLTFITYEIARLQLDFNMGTMQLDNEGLWIDPGKIGPDYGEYDPWVWRNSPGSIGQQDGKDDTNKKIDEALEQLPPGFMLPQAEPERLSPVGTGVSPALPRGRIEG